MPPVFGPRSPSHRRLWSRATGRATARVPSQIAMTLASRPVEPLLDHERRRAGRRGRARNEGARSSACSSRLGDDHALAAGQAVRLEHRPACPRVELADERAAAPARRRRRTRGRGPSGPRPPPRPRGRTPSTSRVARPPASGPNTGMPAAASASATPAPRAAPRARRRRAPRRGARRRATTARRIERVHAGQRPDPGSAADRRAAGGHDDLVHAGLAGELPGQRVLAAAAARRRGRGSA